MPPMSAPAPMPPAVVNLSRCFCQKLLPCRWPSPTHAAWVCQVSPCLCRNLPQVRAETGADNKAIRPTTISRENTLLIHSSFRLDVALERVLLGACSLILFRQVPLVEGLKQGLWRIMVPEVGLEPTCPCERQILSLVRIPISPLRQQQRG